MGLLSLRPGCCFQEHLSGAHLSTFIRSLGQCVIMCTAGKMPRAQVGRISLPGGTCRSIECQRIIVAVLFNWKAARLGRSPCLQSPCLQWPGDPELRKKPAWDSKLHSEVPLVQCVVPPSYENTNDGSYKWFPEAHSDMGTAVYLLDCSTPSC